MEPFPSDVLGGQLILLFVVFMLAGGMGGIAGFALIHGLLAVSARGNNSWTGNRKFALSLVGALCGAIGQWAGWYSGLWYHWFMR